MENRIGMDFIYFIISFIASIIGAISGIGGGVIIKPVLDGVSSLGVSTISFLSGTTVLSMTAVSLLKNRTSTVSLNLKYTSLMAAGGVIGGLAGKYLFDILKTATGNDQMVGVLQSVLLFIITTAVLLFALAKDKIRPHHSESLLFSIFIGFLLGAVASFLGIGGGPINLAVLYFFFSMDTKTAAINSIFIIFFSQLTSLLFTIFAGTVPAFEPFVLIIMCAGGIGGGIVGSHLLYRMSNKAVDYLFISTIGIIILLTIYNTLRWIL